MNLQATALTFQRLALVAVVLMATCMAVSLGGSPTLGFIAALFVGILYMIGIVIAAAAIGWRVAAKLVIRPPQQTDSSISIEPGSGSFVAAQGKEPVSSKERSGRNAIVPANVILNQTPGEGGIFDVAEGNGLLRGSSGKSKGYE